MSDNLFTPKLLDIIIPTIESTTATDHFEDIFIVMDHFDQNLNCVFTRVKSESFTEGHVITIIYNMLCAINFLHSANIIHRDLKPSNILLTNQCNVIICDFGLARSMPMFMTQDTTIETSSYP